MHVSEPSPSTITPAPLHNKQIVVDRTNITPPIHNNEKLYQPVKNKEKDKHWVVIRTPLKFILQILLVIIMILKTCSTSTA